jgi:urea transporter
MPGVGVVITVAVDVAHTGLLELGGVPLTVPVSVMEPLSMSAWVTV